MSSIGTRVSVDRHLVGLHLRLDLPLLTSEMILRNDSRNPRTNCGWPSRDYSLREWLVRRDLNRKTHCCRHRVRRGWSCGWRHCFDLKRRLVAVEIVGVDSPSRCCSDSSLGD
jgi:hypothetical protein